MVIHTVADMISELEKVANKEKPIFAYENSIDIQPFCTVDELNDRVDLNLKNID